MLVRAPPFAYLVGPGTCSPRHPLPDRRGEVVAGGGVGRDSSGFPDLCWLCSCEPHPWLVYLDRGLAAPIIVDAYHEFQEPLSLVKRLREALKPDGRLMIIEYKSEYAYIRPLHKMEESQIVGELKLAGFTLSKRFDLLENQHMLIFKKGEANSASENAKGWAAIQ